MFDDIQETRIKENDCYNVTLQIAEDEYFEAYDSVSEMNAKEILENYLLYKHDDGKIGEVIIKHNKNKHTLYIKANLYYTGNDHTDELRIEHL